jgi:hypothetical protein
MQYSIIERTSFGWAPGLLGGELDRSLSRWDANEQLHTVALRAVASNPLERQSNAPEFLSEWRSGVASLKSDINGRRK